MAAVAEVAAVAASLHLPLQTAESATARRRKRTTTTAERMGKTRLLSLPVEQLRVSAVMMTEAGVSSLGVDHHHREARRLEEAGLMASSHGRAKKERVKWTSVHASVGEEVVVMPLDVLRQAAAAPPWRAPPWAYDGERCLLELEARVM